MKMIPLAGAIAIGLSACSACGGAANGNAALSAEPGTVEWRGITGPIAPDPGYACPSYSNPGGRVVRGSDGTISLFPPSDSSGA